MKTIDELLTEVAKNLNVQQPEPRKPAAVKEDEPNRPKPAPKPLKSLKLNLRTAKMLAAGVEHAAERLGVNVVTAVVNSGARLICLEAMDNAYIVSVQAAQDKAYTAAALKMPTYRALEESRGGALDGLTNGGGILLLAGGEPLYSDGELVGAVGVSGGTKDQDALLAKVAAELFKNL